MLHSRANCFGFEIKRPSTFSVFEFGMGNVPLGTEWGQSNASLGCQKLQASTMDADSFPCRTKCSKGLTSATNTSRMCEV